MPLPLATVLANPYNTIDHEARPTCAVSFEDAPHAYIGASRSEKPGAPVPLHPDKTYSQVLWSFSDEPSRVAASRVMRKHAAAGNILAADETSARLLGVPYADPMKAREATKARAAKRHEAECGALPPWATKPEAKTTKAAPRAEG